MTLAAGGRLGPFEVLSPLGAGGMGEVWRARDTRLGRDVAVKRIPPDLAGDPARVARFEREAKLLASMSHPNVATLYGVERVDGDSLLVMELVEGTTLAARIARGPVPAGEALAIARQVAEALEAAHGRGVVHRDLKPANVMVTPEGRVKVLDFGLAKAWREDDGSPSEDPTITHTGTAAGLIVGTPAYMSPEQARGRPVDRRTDVWAFGVLLFEMLSGRRLFAGESVSDSLAAVLEREIDWSALPATTPARARRVLRRCLVRDPRQRLHDIADARLDLEDDAEPVAPAPPESSARLSRVLPWAVAAAALALAAFAVLRPRAAAPPPPPPVRFTVTPMVPGTIESYPALSPDGRSLAYVLDADDGRVSLWLHSFDSGAARALPDTEGADQPFWSPDGRFLGFFADGAMRKIEVASGVVQTIGAVPDPRGATWGAGGDIVFGQGAGSGLFRVRDGGGPVQAVTRVDSARQEQSHRFPTFLPDGRHFVFSLLGSPNAVGLYVGDTQGGGYRKLVDDYWRAGHDPRGFLVFLRSGTLVAQRFDAARGALDGDAMLLSAGRAGTNPQLGGESWLTAAGGVVAYRPGTTAARKLVWVDREGKELAEVASLGPFREPSLSPDGRRVVISKYADNGRLEVWAFDTAGHDLGERVALDSPQVFAPIWSPDGRWLAYAARGGAAGVVVARRRLDGAGTEEVLLAGVAHRFVADWTPDGRTILFEQTGESTMGDTWAVEVAPPHAVRPVLQGPATEAQARLSPDGGLVSYTSDETGRPEVYVQRYPPTTAKWQVTRSGGSESTWRGDGRELYYIGGDRVLYAVAVESRDPLVLGTPRPLFRPRVSREPITAVRTQYAPADDGRRFLVARAVPDSATSRIEVLLNWTPPAASR